MKERLLEFLRVENKSSAQFAEEIGVQPSGISHILSGRNKPSLDFILKMLGRYNFISTDWILFGKGSMYKENRLQILFDENNFTNQHSDPKLMQNEPLRSDTGEVETGKEQSKTGFSDLMPDNASSIRRIVWFYDNNSFEEYFPRHQSKSLNHQ